MWKHSMHRCMFKTYMICLKNARQHNCAEGHTCLKHQVTGIDTATHQCIGPCRDGEAADSLSCTDKDQEAIGMYHLAKVAQPELWEQTHKADFVPGSELACVGLAGQLGSAAGWSASPLQASSQSCQQVGDQLTRLPAAPP